MLLSELASRLLTATLIGDGATIISGIEADNRKVQAGDLFLCLPGHRRDGHDFAPSAVEKGAVAIVTERVLDVKVPQLVVKSSRAAMAILASAFFGRPGERLGMIGITGTNGKTTTSYLIEAILAKAGKPAGVIGTVEMRYGGRAYPMSGTTPDALELQRSLANMVQAGCSHCVMEVSSHALEQGRVKGCRYRTAIFTNLTQDHLDYHHTVENYLAAKSLLFSRLGNSYAEEESERCYAVINRDDGAYGAIAHATATEVITYGVDHPADIHASNISITAKGTSFHVVTFAGKTDITLRMVGKFNVYNALAAIAAGLIEGIPLAEIKSSLEEVLGVPGRVEPVDEGQPYAVLVDYAHTPDGLENVLSAVRAFAPKRVLCVFGCGGDRDRTKRPIMGSIAARIADYVIITSDNPRSEPPEEIMKEINAGIDGSEFAGTPCEMIEDRRTAIEHAMELAEPGDVIVIAGKGHEPYQLIGAETLDFDDRQVAREAIRRRMG